MMEAFDKCLESLLLSLNLLFMVQANLSSNLQANTEGSCLAAIETKSYISFGF